MYITDAREREIRQECRRAYRDGSSKGPYTKGTVEGLVWESELLKIEFNREFAR